MNSQAARMATLFIARGFWMANRRKVPTLYRLFSKGRFGERPYCTGGRRTAYVPQESPYRCML